jgi:hypothetical protein
MSVLIQEVTEIGWASACPLRPIHYNNVIDLLLGKTASCRWSYTHDLDWPRLG